MPLSVSIFIRPAGAYVWVLFAQNMNLYLAADFIFMTESTWLYSEYNTNVKFYSKLTAWYISKWALRICCEEGKRKWIGIFNWQIFIFAPFHFRPLVLHVQTIELNPVSFFILPHPIFLLTTAPNPQDIVFACSLDAPSIVLLDDQRRPFSFFSGRKSGWRKPIVCLHLYGTEVAGEDKKSFWVVVLILKIPKILPTKFKTCPFLSMLCLYVWIQTTYIPIYLMMRPD